MPIVFLKLHRHFATTILKSSNTSATLFTKDPITIHQSHLYVVVNPRWIITKGGSPTPFTTTPAPAPWGQKVTHRLVLDWVESHLIQIWTWPHGSYWTGPDLKLHPTGLDEIQLKAYFVQAVVDSRLKVHGVQGLRLLPGLSQLSQLSQLSYLSWDALLHYWSLPLSHWPSLSSSKPGVGKHQCWLLPWRSHSKSSSTPP